jgi:hypothetical protein
LTLVGKMKMRMKTRSTTMIGALVVLVKRPRMRRSRAIRVCAMHSESEWLRDSR